MVASTSILSKLNGANGGGDTWPEMRLVDVGVGVGRNGLLGYGLDQSQVEKVRRFGPPIFKEVTANSIEDTLGFFIAKFTKIVI